MSKVNPIKHWREKRKMSQAELADKIGSTQSIVARWEAGAEPMTKNLIKLAKALRVRIDKLIQ